MGLTGIYRVPRVDRDVCNACGGTLCACSFAISRWQRDRSSSASCARGPTASGCAVLKSFSHRTKGPRCPTSPEDSISAKLMCATSSTHSTTKASPHWTPNTVSVGPKSSPKNNAAPSSRPRSARPTYSANRINAGHCRSCATFSLAKRSSSPLLLKPSAKCSRRPRSNCDEPKPGKSATIRSWPRKKSHPPIREQARRQWPDYFLRRIRPAGNSPAGRSKLRAKRAAIAGYLQSQTWRATLAGVLRCARQSSLGLYQAEEALARSITSIEKDAPSLSRPSTHSSDPRQLFTTRHASSPTMVRPKQYSPDQDTHQCIVAQPDRMPIHPSQGIRDPKHQLQQPQRTKPSPHQIRQLPKPTRKEKTQKTILETALV